VDIHATGIRRCASWSRATRASSTRAARTASVPGVASEGAGRRRPPDPGTARARTHPGTAPRETSSCPPTQRARSRGGRARSLIAGVEPGRVPGTWPPALALLGMTRWTSVSVSSWTRTWTPLESSLDTRAQVSRAGREEGPRGTHRPCPDLLVAIDVPPLPGDRVVRRAVLPARPAPMFRTPPHSAAGDKEQEPGRASGQQRRRRPWRSAREAVARVAAERRRSGGFKSRALDGSRYGDSGSFSTRLPGSRFATGLLPHAVPKVRFELTRPCGRPILSRLRLPFRHSGPPEA
jgi:hypothetical protein